MLASSKRIVPDALSDHFVTLNECHAILLRGCGKPIQVTQCEGECRSGRIARSFFGPSSAAFIRSNLFYMQHFLRAVFLAYFFYREPHHKRWWNRIPGRSVALPGRISSSRLGSKNSTRPVGQWPGTAPTRTNRAGRPPNSAPTFQIMRISMISMYHFPAVAKESPTNTSTANGR
jgi:hypothetical protein